MLEILQYVPMVYGYLSLGASLVDGLLKWARGEFAESDVLDPAVEDRIVGGLGSVAALLKALLAGLSAFNTKR